MTTIEIMRLAGSEDIPLPRYETDNAAGMDLAAAIDAPVRIEAGDWQLIPTGFAMAIPVGFEAQVRPRSGLAVKHGVTVLNAPGTIDADYRGEVKVILINHGAAPFIVHPGMRIAQMVIAPVVQAHVEMAKSLDDTARATGGFGSTGR